MGKANGGLGRPEDIRFPVVCHYKIIAEDRAALKDQIESVFREVNISVTFLRTGRSDRGKYVTYSADVLIHSLSLMRFIDKALRAIKGVRLVL